MKYLKGDMKIKYTNAIFKGKYLFGINNWGGCGAVEKNLIQIQQHIAAKITLGPKNLRKTKAQRLKMMNWLDIDSQIKWNSHVRTYKAINETVDHELSKMFKLNRNNNRLQTHKKPQSQDS